MSLASATHVQVPAPQAEVFQAQFGFYDTVVASASQAAALRAWGTHQNLFASREATIATDETAIEAALRYPETPLRRAVVRVNRSSSNRPAFRRSLLRPSSRRAGPKGRRIAQREPSPTGQRLMPPRRLFVRCRRAESGKKPTSGGRNKRWRQGKSPPGRPMCWPTNRLERMSSPPARITAKPAERTRSSTGFARP